MKIPRLARRTSVAATVLAASVGHAQIPRASIAVTAVNRPDTVGLTLAVMRFTNGAVGKANATLEPLSLGIPEILISELALDSKIRLFERSRLDEVVREQRIAKTGMMDQESAVRAGKLLGAAHVVFGGFMAAHGDSIRVVSRLVNVAANSVEAVVTEQGAVDDVLTLLTKTGARLVATLDPVESLATSRADLPSRAIAPPRESASAPLAAVLFYSRALQASLQHRSSEARALLTRAVEAAPGWQKPLDELDRLDGARRTR